MFKKLDVRSTLISGLIAGLLFCVPVTIYIRLHNFYESWLLYLGSLIFLIVIFIHTYLDNRKRNEDESTVTMIFASHMATITGILVACLGCFLLLSIGIPGYLSEAHPDKVLTNEPVNIIKDKTQGLSFIVFMAATVVNFAAGSFVGIILPFYTKRNQTRDDREPSPLHQNSDQ